MKKTAFISDVIFTFFAAGFCALCLFRYLRISFYPALLLSAVCGALAACSVFFWLQSKRKTVFLKKSDAAMQEKLFLHLALLSDEQKTEFFQQLLSLETPVKRFGKLRLYSDDAFFQIRCGFSIVTAEDVAAFSRLRTGKTKKLLCHQIHEDALALANKLNIDVLNADSIFSIVKTHDAFPRVFLGEDTLLRKKKGVRTYFAKQNGKRFFTSGLLLLILSVFTPFSYYYLIFGGILLLTSLLLRIFGFEKADL